MPERTMLRLCGVLAGLAVAVVAGRAEAADDCLANPSGTTPAGQHWYYRIERPSQRKCWYLRDEGAKTADAKTTDAASGKRATAKPVAPVSTAASEEPVADAHAELIPGTPTEQPSPPAQMRQSAAPKPPAVGTTTGGGQDGPVASRWPNPGDTLVADRMPAPSDTPKVMASAEPQPAVTAADPAVSQPADTQDAPSYVQYGVLAGAIALAAICIGALIGFASAKRRPATQIHDAQGPAGHEGIVADTRARIPTPAPAARSASLGQARPAWTERAPPLTPKPPRHLHDEIEELDRLLAASRRSAPARS
jgi:hypothetical protein